MTNFGVGPYSETEQVVVFNATDTGLNDGNYVYNWWGCMNSFYIGMILLLFYVLAA